MDGETAATPALEEYGHGPGAAVRPSSPTARSAAQIGAPLLLCGLLGAALGLVGARYLFVGSALSLLPWGIVAVAIGATSAARIDVLARSGCYGFVLAFVFMLSGYTGRAAIAAELFLFTVLGLFGAVCAVLLAYAGFAAGARARRS